MTVEQIDSTASRWARLGVWFSVVADQDLVDLERLLLDTARCASSDSRAFVMAVTWLAQHGDVVAKHRLVQLIRDELEEEHRPVMGLMLDLARQAGRANRTRFNQAIALCAESIEGAARPLADVMSESALLRDLAFEQASDISKKWGRWYEDFALKNSALRPASWVFENNPELRERALAGGDLVASILAEAQASGGKFESESDLARRCGASRPAIRSALDTLVRSGRARIVRSGRSSAIDLL